MRKLLWLVPLLALPVVLTGPRPAESACCYFAAKDKDISQPAQKAFITWDPEEKVETFTVQPKFEGNAVDFGMVIPTPSKPKLDPMPRDFFKELAVFTILEPMNLDKYKSFKLYQRGAVVNEKADRDKGRVKVLEAGIVGSLEYKVLETDRADALYTWLKDNKYSYSGDEATLGYYIKKKWFFTVMKIDPKQMKKRSDGTYDGEVTPTRLTFASERLVYPLKITQISVKDKTEALFYVQAPHKVDLPGDFSYQFTWEPMWSQATSFALPEKLTQQEKDWQKLVQPKVQGYVEKVNQLRQKKVEPATLEWARKITDADIDVLTGKKKYNREAPPEDVKKLKELVGHVKKGQFITKMRKVFTKGEMNDDLEFVRAKVGDRNDDIEYYSILPTSPP
ncbi:MAG TPA: DUF2330 domain-containing protein [Gemmataceae bacterium]|nr:DUF2330 domain-containing protein [Gemmataceae bacterium]